MIKVDKLGKDKVTITLELGDARWLLCAAWRHASKLAEGSRAARHWRKMRDQLWNAYTLASSLDEGDETAEVEPSSMVRSIARQFDARMLGRIADALEFDFAPAMDRSEAEDSEHTTLLEVARGLRKLIQWGES